MKFCSDFPGKEECCYSCHQDADEGYDDLCWGYAPDGAEYLVCCARLRNMDDPD